MIAFKHKWRRLVTEAGFADKPYFFSKISGRGVWVVKWNSQFKKWDLRDKEYRIIASFLSPADGIKTANSIDEGNEKQQRLLCQ